MLKLSGKFFWEHHSASGLLLAKGVIPNAVVTAALNDILEVYFRSGTQKASWFVGLIDSASFSALSAADTISSHSGWTESVSYTEAARQAWNAAAAVSGRMAASTRAAFTMNSSITLKGLFVASNSTKGGTTGTLWATALFPADKTFATGEVLSTAYNLTAANS